MGMPDFTSKEVREHYFKFHGADLQGLNLIKANLRGAKYHKWTAFPEGFDPEAAGMVLKE